MEFSKIVLDRISYYLRERNETISVAESVTSGSIQQAFSQMPSAENFYSGGITTYTLEQKVKHLNVDQQEAEKANCVSKSITETMALNVAKLFDTDWAVATTGYSTPVEESKGEIFAHYAVVYQDEIIISDCIELHPLTKPMDAQQYFTEVILSRLRAEVRKKTPKLTTKY